MRDFVINVVQEPVVVAGNSIGGIIPANACADDPDLFRGLVLINTAGSADEEWDPANPPTKEAPNKLIANLLSRVSFVYLQRGIRKQLERLYPTRPYNAGAQRRHACCQSAALASASSSFWAIRTALNDLIRGSSGHLQRVRLVNSPLDYVSWPCCASGEGECSFLPNDRANGDGEQVDRLAQSFCL